MTKEEKKKNSDYQLVESNIEGVLSFAYGLAYLSSDEEKGSEKKRTTTIHHISEIVGKYIGKHVRITIRDLDLYEKIHTETCQESGLYPTVDEYY